MLGKNYNRKRLASIWLKGYNAYLNNQYHQAEHYWQKIISKNSSQCDAYLGLSLLSNHNNLLYLEKIWQTRDQFQQLIDKEKYLSINYCPGIFAVQEINNEQDLIRFIAGQKNDLLTTSSSFINCVYQARQHLTNHCKDVLTLMKIDFNQQNYFAVINRSAQISINTLNEELHSDYFFLTGCAHYHVEQYERAIDNLSDALDFYQEPEAEKHIRLYLGLSLQNSYSPNSQSAADKQFAIVSQLDHLLLENAFSNQVDNIKWKKIIKSFHSPAITDKSIQDNQ
jgi:hypothetical protein